MFQEDFKEKVRSAHNIVDFINEYTELKRRGNRFTGLCPFPDHVEKTPSFSVSDDKQVYHCFGCKRSGDIFTFLSEFKSMNFMEALHFFSQQSRHSHSSTNSKGSV